MIIFILKEFHSVFGNTKGGAWSTSPYVAKDMIIEHLQEIGLPNEHYILMTDAGGFTFDLEGNQSPKYTEKELTAKLNDPLPCSISPLY